MSNRIGYKKIFTNDKDKLLKMMEMRRNGWTYVSLGLIFGVDHSSIYKWCKVIKRPSNVISIDLSGLIEASGIYQPDRPVKSYADYLLEEKRRNSRLYKYATNIRYEF